MGLGDGIVEPYVQVTFPYRPTTQNSRFQAKFLQVTRRVRSQDFFTTHFPFDNASDFR